MSKFSKKFNLTAKGILYAENGIISVENEETGELVQIASMLDDFNGKECTLTIAYNEDLE